MKKLIAPAVALLMVAACSFASAKDSELKSGLQVGERTPAYVVNDVTGPKAGTSLCYRCKYGGRPVVNIFARKMTPEVADLIAKIDAKVGDNKRQRMAAFVVHLTDDADESATKLKMVAKKNHIENTPLTNYEGLSGPSNYKIAKDADVTVMMWVGGKVKVNHALKKGELSKDAIKEIVADTKKILK